MAIRNPMGVINGPYSSDADTTYGDSGISYGADAETARMKRELVMRGLSDALAKQHQTSLETPEIAEQRANILGHGTIETPQDFQYRTKSRDAADVTNPASPIGAAGALAHTRDLDKLRLAPGGVASMQIAGQNQLGVEGIKRQTALDESGDRLAGSMYDSDADAESKVESELANQVIGAKFNSDADRTKAVQGFLESLNLLRRTRPAAAGAR